MSFEDYFIGFDIGTDSLGYAAVDPSYSLKKFRGEPVWGVALFDEAKLNADRRAHRTARRRLDRRKQRVGLIRELFAHEIEAVDPKFYARMDASRLLCGDADSNYTLFEDAGFTDADYNGRYPTIHHLIYELMTSDEPHDVRLVYLACAWLVAHRGHFLSEISAENVAELTDFTIVWKALEAYINNSNDDVKMPWPSERVPEAGIALKGKAGVNAKYRRLCETLFGEPKAPKVTEGFPYNCEHFLRALCGGKIDAAKLFDNEAYKDQKFSLGDPDETIEAALGALGDDAELIICMKAVYDWALLVDILGDSATISAAKVGVYDRHKADLKTLKSMVRKYCPDRYGMLFESAEALSYTSYSGHCTREQKSTLKKSKKPEFSDNLRNKVFKGVVPADEDAAAFNDMIERLQQYTFLPKQKDTDNRVIPHQLYQYEMKQVLKKASAYLPFLMEKDADGMSVSDKLLSVFTYRIPYYVGPLNRKSEHAWIVRKGEGRILPWNFDRMVDKDASEQAFIKKMTNRCTYLPDADVLPKESLLYHRFTVLNEINNLKIDGVPIPVEVKQSIYINLFEKKRKITPRAIREYLHSIGAMTNDQTLSGVDLAIHADLKSYHDFKRLLEEGTLTEEQVETIIEHITYTEDKNRLKKWLKEHFGFLKEGDIRYIVRLNYKDFGRLSKELLMDFEGVNRRTGEIFTILHAMWETNDNLMELLSERYTFRENVEAYQKAYYAGKPLSLDDRLKEMRLSNAVKRPVLRAIEVTREIAKAMKHPPKKIFIEMTRGASEDQKNKRTLTRKEQLIRLYESCRDEDVRLLREQLEAMGDAAETRLQSDRLFLYYAQLGKCVYSGREIDLNLLAGDTYNIEHIYPRSLVKDDSIINNEVLVLSTLNGQKSDDFPIAKEIRQKMTPFWDRLKKIGLISEEKHRRLTRNTPFTADEKLGFINRQLTETSQSAKATATILGEMYPEAEIVYVKARLASEFRQAFGLLKSRTFNDLHHAKDAYLNVVVGNVYTMRFTKRWFSVDEKYSVKPETLYTHPVICNGETVWNGRESLDKVKRTVRKNTAHMTRYAFCRKEGLFDQNPVKAAESLIPLKKGLPTDIYGGYNKATISFFVPVRFKKGKKYDIMIMSVDLMNAERFKVDEAFAMEYAKERIERIIKKQVSDVEFPLGKRIIKINTMLSLDGFRVCVAGSANVGKCIIAMPFMPFSADHDMELYVKRMEKLAEKVKKNARYVFSEKYDNISAEMNLRLYDLYVDKLTNSIYAKRPNNPLKLLTDGRERFRRLDPIAQVNALLNIHQVFGRVSGGIDLQAIGGAAHAAATSSFSTTVSNWAKSYKDVRIIDASASGLWEKTSVNLLELL